MKSRKIPISAAGALFCLIVIFIHVISPVISNANRSAAGYAAALAAWRLSAFVVQGFILLSGIKLGLKFSRGEQNWKLYYLSRVKRILLPYILWAVIYYIWFWQNHYYSFSASKLLRYIIFGDLSAHFYFVVVIIQFYALAPLWKLLTEKLHGTVLLLASAYISLLSAQYLPELLSLFGVKDFLWSDRIFTSHLVWWLAGIYIGRDWPAFEHIIAKSRLILALSALLFGMLDAKIVYEIWVLGNWHAFAEPVHMLYVSSAIMLALSLGTLIRQNGRITRAILAVDSAGYGIYLSHVFVILATERLLNYFGTAGLLRRFVISAGAVYTISVAANICYIKLKEKLYLKITGTKNLRPDKI